MPTLKIKALTRDCPACPHLASGRMAERVAAVTGCPSEQLFCLVKREISAVSLAEALRRRRRIRACHLNHRAQSQGRENLRTLERQAGLKPLGAKEGGEACP
jgi:hypothetical protein